MTNSGFASPLSTVGALLIVFLAFGSNSALANDLTTVLETTVGGLKTTNTASGTCAKNAWRRDAFGNQLDTPCPGVTVTCPAGHIPLGTGSSFLTCEITPTATPQLYYLEGDGDVSVKNRTATCNIEGNYYTRKGYTPHCYYVGLLPGEQAAVADRDTCWLPRCNGSNAPCKPDNTFKVQLYGVNSGTPVCAKPRYINNSANATCFAEQISVSAKCIRRPNDASLKLLGIDVTK